MKIKKSIQKITYQYSNESDDDHSLEVSGERIQTDLEFDKFCEQMKQNYIDGEKRDRDQYERLREQFEKDKPSERKEYAEIRKKLEDQEKHEREEYARLKSKYDV